MCNIASINLYYCSTFQHTRLFVSKRGDANDISNWIEAVIYLCPNQEILTMHLIWLLKLLIFGSNTYRYIHTHTYEVLLSNQVNRIWANVSAVVDLIKHVM